ncbi:RNA polymerase-associated protein [Allofrancisella inopinata]|uniref:Glutathione S-transferase n=1 Tax=Allofrancisella inopinata TaxID=1085647 RepID=A0AAE6YJ79_9GAMM|nr:glutathione S-transferase N-terminal domain-containing protein [Allofrancisella inopinata]QIV95757.1 glutathione S-transferase [Allofrancisella inopinata]TDT72851.1 RNA polymerase-associated protein [Allofrancisella inopinata]
MKVTLYTAKYCPYSLRARIALAEKKMNVEVIESGDLSSEMLKKISPDGIFPVLKEKDYSINNRKALLIYIDERFPAPGLLPSLVNERIRIRLSLDKIDNEWYPVLEEIKKNRNNKNKLDSLFKNLKESFLTVEKVFTETDFFICSNFTLADCYIAAYLISLEAEGFIIDESFGAIYKYKKQIFARDSVKKANLKGNANDSLLKTLRAHR